MLSGDYNPYFIDDEFEIQVVLAIAPRAPISRESTGLQSLVKSECLPQGR